MEAVKLSSIALLVLFISFPSSAMSAVSEMRWCTYSSFEQSKCQSMRTAFAENNLSPSVTCIAGDSIPDCFQEIQDGRADLITLDGGDIYTSGKEYGLVPIVQEIYSKDTYYGIAVVKADNTEINNFADLRNKRSCHTGYRRTAGWNIPVGFLLDGGYMTPTDCGDDVNAVANFFSASCAPGVFTTANDPYGNNPAKLCSICSDTNCPPDDNEDYWGYAGALRCLAEGAGDVAFIKPETVMENTDGQGTEDWNMNLTSSDFKILCPDGTTNTVENAESCNMAQSAAHAVMTSGNQPAENIQAFQAVLAEAVTLFGADDNTNGFTLFDSAQWNGRDLLFKDTTQNLRDLAEGQTYRTYLGELANTIDGLNRCPENTIRWCTVSAEETRKCRDMRDAFAAAGITPNISCYQDASHALCIDRVANGDADAVTVDGGDLYLGGRQNKIAPLAGENYGFNNDGDASYWAVAVASKDTDFGIDDLEQRKSCHTGISKTAGWNVPVGHLIKIGDIKVDNGCDVPMAVGTFFSGGSCAPGAKSSAYDPMGTNPESLCQLCIGEGDNFCVRNSNEPYEGYSGAFRCLAEGAGDVAFVRQSTVPENTDGNGNDGWNNALMSQNYQLLCTDGTRAEISEWQNCYLARVPSHAVVTGINKTAAQRQEIWNVLNLGQNRYAPDPSNAGNFGMFDSSAYTGSDLLFKDNTQSLVNVGNRDTYDTWLSEEYIEDLEAVTCDYTGAAPAVAQASVFLVVLMLIAQVMGLAPVAN